MSEARTCSHIKINGTLCRAIALKGDHYCYFHRDARERVKRQVRNARHYEPIYLPLLEDRESIQICLHEVMLAIIKQRIDIKQASLLLYSLQIATYNARDLDFEGAKAEARAEAYDYDEPAALEREIEADREADIETIADKNAEIRAARLARDRAQRELDEELKKALPPKKPAQDDTFWLEVNERIQQKAEEKLEANRKL
jgi:hypothetical protein